MEKKAKIKIAITIASLAAISILFTRQQRRRRKLNQRSQYSCYLQSEPKPQHNFKRVLADNSYSPFKHANKEKSSGSHPYELEITALLENPRPEFDFSNVDLDLQRSDSFIWVETKSQLNELANALSKEFFFAVDTEQHSLRSFLGFTALIQISTEKEDYLVDTIALHDEISILQPFFADPGVCKVFHGSDNDVLWLQRDFHIYVVNLFDTAKACEVLSKPQKSLAYLLETYCGVATNKFLQREDWRQRPLPAEMLQYAQTDAHYLLYIAKCLVAELKQQGNENSYCPDDKFNFVLEASRRSNMVCLQVYTKEIESYPGEAAASSIFFRLLNGQGGVSSISSVTQDLVRRLCAWRDLMARVHDESLRFVLSDQAIIALANKALANPTDVYTTIAQADSDVDCLNLSSSLPSPSPVVCSHLDDVERQVCNNVENLDDILLANLQKCLGPNGSCPLSVFNYVLPAKSNWELKNQSNKFVYKQNGVKISRQVAKKASRDLFVQKFSCKSPVYHNCRIYANDGRLLCYCDRKKLEWYLTRDLAKLVEDNPPAIMLLFEPKGRPEDEGNEFYIQSKKNICVSCGEGNHYLRYRIIPSCYRIHFPEQLKSHRSHDIVLLCVDCHEVAHAAAEKYKKQISAEFGIPLFIHKLRTAAMALLHHGRTMPSNRREELRRIVMRYYGGREISQEDLERALLVGMSPRERRRHAKKRGLSLKMSKPTDFPDRQQDSYPAVMVESATMDATKADNVLGLHAIETQKSGHGPHGKQVVDYLLREYGEDGIRQFCQRWRQVFVEALHPHFLPAGWDVMHSGRREFGEFSVYNPAKKPADDGAAEINKMHH
ncbi:hypothetical protein AB3S75_009292 [Citrus x aurantiifolia]